MRPILAGALCCLLGLATPARAERRPFLFAHDVGTVPGGDVEVETWLDYLDSHDPTTGASNGVYRWWIGPRWSPVEGLEVTALTVIAQDVVAPSKSESSAYLWAEQLEVRWRFFQRDWLGALYAQLDGRIAISNDLPHQVAPSLGWTRHAGRFGFSAQLGYAAGFLGPSDDADHKDEERYHWLVWRAGVSCELVRGEIAPLLVLGVEGFGEVVFAGKNDLTDGDQRGLASSTANLGPTLSIARGRLWLTLGALAGLTDASPRVIVRGVIGLAL
jgi:hypothetical protein